MEKQKLKQKREEFVVKIGPLLKRVLDEQKKSVDSVTYDCIKCSYFESGEICAKKILGLD